VAEHEQDLARKEKERGGGEEGEHARERTGLSLSCPDRNYLKRSRSLKDSSIDRSCDHAEWRSQRDE